MTHLTVTLRIQELAEAKGLTLEEISNDSGVAEQALQKYTAKPLAITEEAATDLRKIADKLGVSVLDLVKPVAHREAFKLNIIEKIKQKGLTLEELAERSGVNLALLEFYSTQPICKSKLAEAIHQTHLSQLSKVLECCTEELKVAADLPTMMFQVENLAKEKGLSLENLSLLTGLPNEFIDLVATQPIDTSAFSRISISKKNICDILPEICSRR